MLTRALTFLLFACCVSRAAAQIYCLPTTTSGPDLGDFIANVELGGINYGTGYTPGVDYHNYSYAGPNSVTRLNGLFTSNTISITTGTATNAYYAAWIDWYDDGGFTEAELIGNQQSTTAGQVITFNFFTPVLSARPGYATLRVRCAYGMAVANPCGNFVWGETEDYQVLIETGPCIPLMS